MIFSRDYCKFLETVACCDGGRFARGSGGFREPAHFGPCLRLALQRRRTETGRSACRGAESEPWVAF